MSEQIYKQIPKQRRSVENYEAPFPVPPIEIEISDELLDKLLETIDEVTDITEPVT